MKAGCGRRILQACVIVYRASGAEKVVFPGGDVHILDAKRNPYWVAMVLIRTQRGTNHLVPSILLPQHNARRSMQAVVLSDTFVDLEINGMEPYAYYDVAINALKMRSRFAVAWYNENRRQCGTAGFPSEWKPSGRL